MKKFTLAALALVASAFAAQAADGNTFTSGDLKYTVLSEEEGTVAVACSSYTQSGDIVIPMTVENEGTTYFVTEVANAGFGSCPITSVTLPESILKINDSAFYNCTSMKSVNIPNSVTYIGTSAFRYAVRYQADIKLSAGCSFYGNYAFQQCMAVKELTIPACVDGAITIGNYAFAKATVLERLNLPGEYTKIGTSGVADFATLQVYLYSQNPFATSFSPAAKTTVHVSDSLFAEDWLVSGVSGWANCRWTYDLDSNPWPYVTEVSLPATAMATVGVNTKLALETRAAADDIVWRSSDISVAFVDQQGNVYPRKEGKATITAMACSSSKDVVKAECEVTVAGNNQDGVTAIAAEKDSRIFNLQGVEMNPNTTLPAGIYVKGGKKIVVK